MVKILYKSIFKFYNKRVTAVLCVTSLHHYTEALLNDCNMFKNCVT